MAGRSGRCADLVDGRVCEISVGNLVVSLGYRGLTNTELSQVVAGLHPATDLADPSTWSDVDAAIP